MSRYNSTEAAPLEFVPDPAPLTVIPVVGNVTRCSDSNESLSKFVDVSPTENSPMDGGMGMLESGFIDVHGRVVYENVITAESAGNSLPQSPHPYPSFTVQS